MTNVKICGITNLDDALIAVDAGADALGFNFYEGSSRYIAPEAANRIVRKLPSDVMTVGIVVNESLDEVKRFLARTRIRHVQLHGDESPEFVESIAQWAGDAVVVIKALRIADGFDANSVSKYDVEHFLLDSSSSRGYGGTGDTFDWRHALEFKKIHPDFYLAGGLTPDNVAEAIRTVRPYAVDVCSGVESTKGKKDPAKVAAFIRNAKDAI